MTSNRLSARVAERAKRRLRAAGYTATRGYGRGLSWTRYEKGQHVVIVTRHFTGPDWSAKPSDTYTLDGTYTEQRVGKRSRRAGIERAAQRVVAHVLEQPEMDEHEAVNDGVELAVAEVFGGSLRTAQHAGLANEVYDALAEHAQYVVLNGHGLVNGTALTYEGARAVQQQHGGDIRNVARLAAFLSEAR